MPPKYQNIAQQFISDIDSGKMSINSKLPSLRKLSELHDISMTTAMACYRYLEQQGYADAQSQRGFYVQRPLSLINETGFPQFESQVTVPAVTNKNQIIPGDTLATAQLDSRLIDHGFLKQCFISTVKSGTFQLHYESPQGNELLRQQLSEHFTQQGFVSHSEEFIITNGCLDAVSMALDAVSKPGDTVAVSSPCYSGLLDILSSMQRTIVEIPSTEDGLDMPQLEQLLQEGKVSACLFTANHQNPSGHSFSEHHKQVLAHLAHRYQIPLIEDDVFRELSHHRTIPLPIKHYDQEGWVIWCGSFSKTLAPGIRLGWCKGGRFQQGLLALRATRTLGVNQPMQQVMANYLLKGHYRRHVKAINRQLSAHLASYLNYFKRHLKEHCQVCCPKGGLVLWIRFPGIDGDKLQRQLSTHSIYVKGGSGFSTTELYREYIRINIGIVPDENVTKQLDVLARLILNHRGELAL